MLKQDGDGKMRSYSLSEQYESRMSILSQAIEIGLNAISERSKGQKYGQKMLAIVVMRLPNVLKYNVF